MTILDQALQACASGVLTAEAGVSLLIDCAGWLHHDDFTSSFITTGTSISDGTALMASIDWDAAITALNGGRLPCSSGFSELKTIINIRCSRVAFRWHEGSR